MDAGLGPSPPPVPLPPSQYFSSSAEILAQAQLSGGQLSAGSAPALSRSCRAPAAPDHSVLAQRSLAQPTPLAVGLKGAAEADGFGF